ncbi:MAG TPA: TIGR02266 family protein, partial [Anaeromyxobacter sp.]
MPLVGEPPDKRSGQRAPSGLLLKLSYGTVDEFVEKFASNVSRGGLFVRTREPRPVGTTLTFELRLAGGEAVMKGQGVVRWVQEENPGAHPPAPSGMGVQFVALDDASRQVVERIVREKEALAARTPVMAPRPVLTPEPTRAPTPVIPMPA